MRSGGISAAFFLGDEVYGGRELRTVCRELGLGYVAGVRSNHQVTTGPVKLSVARAAARLPKRAWQRMHTGAGHKGVRDYDWAMIEVTGDDTPDGHDHDTSVLLVRRHRYTRSVSYYRCFAPGPVTLARLVSLVCLRWRVGEGFQDAKEICHLDKGQVARWNSWHRWSMTARPGRLRVPGHRSRPRTHRTGHPRRSPRNRPRPPQQPRTPPPAASPDPSPTQTRPRPPPVVVHPAPPPTPRPPLPPPLAHVRRHHTTIRKVQPRLSTAAVSVHASLLTKPAQHQHGLTEGPQRPRPPRSAQPSPVGGQ
jgi:hypothetical protein